MLFTSFYIHIAIQSVQGWSENVMVGSSKKSLTENVPYSVEIDLYFLYFTAL